MRQAEALDCPWVEGAPDPVTDASPLSRRESEVAKLVADGMSNRRIGERLYLSERTVEGHVERIRNKLGVRSRTGVATWAVEHGLTVDLTANLGFASKRGAHDGLTPELR